MFTIVVVVICCFTLVVESLNNDSSIDTGDILADKPTLVDIIHVHIFL